MSTQHRKVRDRANRVVRAPRHLPVLVLLAGAAVVANVSWAHDIGSSGLKYPLSCCHGDDKTGDCQMIAPETVTESPTGFQVVLNPGDHRMVTVRQSFRIPYGTEIRSHDGNYHICLYPTQATPFCFFAPPGEV